MKWLYRILRLFMCPHRWERAGCYSIVNANNTIVATIIDQRCTRCGDQSSRRIGL